MTQRTRPAAASRILAIGLSTTATFAIVALLASGAPPATANTTAINAQGTAVLNPSGGADADRGRRRGGALGGVRPTRPSGPFGPLGTSDKPRARAGTIRTTRGFATANLAARDHTTPHESPAATAGDRRKLTRSHEY